MKGIADDKGDREQPTSPVSEFSNVGPEVGNPRRHATVTACQIFKIKTFFLKKSDLPSKIVPPTLFKELKATGAPLW